MSISVDIDSGYEFTVQAPFKTVFDLLSDVPKSVSHFPKVDKLVFLGSGVYRWEMEKVGTAQANIQAVYASKYVSNRSQGSVVWTPVPGVGNAQIGGSWKITRAKKGTALEFRVQGTVEVPLPGLMKAVVAPVVRAEFDTLIEQYIDKLIQQFGGEL